MHHGLDPEPYHAHLMGLWHNYLSSIAERLPRVAPTSGSAGSADRLAAPAHADAVAVGVSAVSGDADVVGTSIRPAGSAAGAAVPAAGLTHLGAAHSWPGRCRRAWSRSSHPSSQGARPVGVILALGWGVL